MANDDFIPAPASPAAPAASDASQTATTAPAPPAVEPEPTTPTTGSGLLLIIALVIVLVLTGVLLFVRSGIKNALISSKVPLDAANFAATLWYGFLLLLSALLSFGLVGGLFATGNYIAVTVGVAVVGLIVCIIATGGAQRRRK